MKLRGKNKWMIKWLNWEFWPFRLFYLPVFAYTVYLCLRARSLFFYSATNPGIEYGGLFGESKFKLLEKISSRYCPEMMYVLPFYSIKKIRDLMNKANLEFPCIAKPDVGERGHGVKLIENEEQLAQYHERTTQPYLIQSFVGLPLELGIFYYRMPGHNSGTISSIVKKKFLTVTGDGLLTVEELMAKDQRASLYIEKLRPALHNTYQNIPKKDEKVVVSQIGNHSRGTVFLNANNDINKQLVAVFDQIAHGIDGFYYGRFDIRCESWEALYEGKSIKILELNGAKAEPAHIYQPGFPLLKAYATLIKHWRMMFKIARLNHKNGVKYMPTWPGAKGFFRYLRHY